MIMMSVEVTLLFEFSITVIIIVGSEDLNPVATELG